MEVIYARCNEKTVQSFQSIKNVGKNPKGLFKW